MAETTIIPRPGYVSNSISIGTRYTLTESDISVSSGGLVIETLGVTGVPEIIKAKITGGATAAQDLTITIRGDEQDISLLLTDDTPAEVATKIAATAGLWTGWTVSVDTDNVTVIWTASASGAKTGVNTFSAGTTGVTLDVDGLHITTLGVSQATEVISFTPESGCIANGNVIVTIRGTAQTIALTTASTTPTAVATALSAGTWAGWVDSVGGSKITWTASAPGAKTGVNNLDDTTTGIVGNDLVFNFNYNNSVNYPLVARVDLLSAAGAVANVTGQGMRITYPDNGKVKVGRGTIGANWVVGAKLNIIAQRSN
jgi:hypothetical protein